MAKKEEAAVDTAQKEAVNAENEAKVEAVVENATPEEVVTNEGNLDAVEVPENAEEIGNMFSTASGYLLGDVPYNSSFAGYKDWFLQEYRRPGYTIEAGIGENPLPISQFDTIYGNNIGILVLGII